MEILNDTNYSGNSVSSGKSIVTIVYSNYPVTLADEIVLVDASSAPVTITLPVIAATYGESHTIKKIDRSSNRVSVVVSDGNLINRNTSFVLSDTDDTVKVVGNGNDWHVSSSSSVLICRNGITTAVSDLLLTSVKPTVITKATIGGVANDTQMWSMAVYKNKLYVGTYNNTNATDATGAKLLVFDGTTWAVITKATMGGANGDWWMRSMAVFNDKLYIGTGNTTAATNATGSKLLVYDGTTWTSITKATMGADANDLHMQSMSVYNSSLYIGTINATVSTDATGAKLIKYDGTTWTTVTKAIMGGVNADTSLSSMAVFNGVLYIGTVNATNATDNTAAKLLALSGATWSVITKTTMGGVGADTAMFSMAVYNSKLYIGTQNVTSSVTATSAKLIVYNGNTWATIIKSAMGGGGANTDTCFDFMAVYNGRLYVGGYNATAAINATAAKLFQFDQAAWIGITKDTLGGVTTDQDLFSMAVFKGNLYIGTYSSTSATDATGSKIIYLAYPIAETLNTYCPRGF